MLKLTHKVNREKLKPTAFLYFPMSTIRFFDVTEISVTSKKTCACAHMRYINDLPRSVNIGSGTSTTFGLVIPGYNLGTGNKVAL
jgi:hypothetical protein